MDWHELCSIAVYVFYEQQFIMSLPPLQSIAPEPLKKPNAAPAPAAETDDETNSFEGELKTVQAKPESAVQPQDEGQQDAVQDGKTLPSAEQDDDSETLLLPAALTLEIENQFDDPTSLGETLLLATRFVVESLQNTTTTPEGGDKTQNLTAPTLERLIKLQPVTNTVGGGNGQITPFTLPPVFLDPDQAVDSLVKVADKSTAASLTDVAAVNSSMQSAEKLAASAPKAEITIPTKVGTSDWSEAMAGRITLMVNQKISAARIHINPPELGPIEVRVNLNNEQASVQFTSQSAQVRDALEQSMPRLREMLETAGFSLADSDVSDQQSGREQQSDSDGAPILEEEEQFTAREIIGLVDEHV